MNALAGRRRFIYLALSVMTGSWLAAVIRGLIGDGVPSIPLTVVVLALLTWVPLELGRGLRQLNLRLNVRRVILALALAFLALLVLSSGFYNQYGYLDLGWMNAVPGDESPHAIWLNQLTSLTLVVTCWWLGLKLGDMRLTSTNLLRYCYIGLAGMAAPSVFFVTDVSQVAPWLFFTYLFAALVALGLGRVEEVGRRSQGEGSPFTTYWVAQIGFSAGVVLALVAVVQLLGLARGLGLVLVVLAPVLAALIYPVAYLGARFIALAFTQVEIPESVAEGAVGSTQTVNPASPQHVCAGLIVLLFFFVTFVIMIFGARRVKEMLKEQEREEGVALPSLGEQVSRAVGERLERLGLDLPGMRGLRRRMVARSIRRIYADLTALGAERGYPRPTARTPYEHVGALRQAFPGCAADVAAITTAYVAVHYGEVPESREALRTIKMSWERVQAAPLRTAVVEEGG